MRLKPACVSPPAKEIPVPTADVSTAAQALIGAPLQPTWNDHPKNAAEWKKLIDMRAEAVAKTLPELRAKLGVTVEPTKIGGVNAFIVTPGNIPEANTDRLLVQVHGGGYVFFPGEFGTREAILMAGYGKFKVISIDYRMPPDFPYPAAMDDAMAVWKEVVKTTGPKEDGDLRYLDRRWHDVGNGPARQERRPAASGRDRARHAVVRHDQDRRHVLHQ